MLNSSLPLSSKSFKPPGHSYKDVSIPAPRTHTALQVRIIWATLTTQKHFIFLSESLHKQHIIGIRNKGNKIWNVRNIIPGQKTYNVQKSNLEGKKLHRISLDFFLEDVLIRKIVWAVTGYHDGGCKVTKHKHWRNGSQAKKDLETLRCKFSHFHS